MLLIYIGWLDLLARFINLKVHYVFDLKWVADLFPATMTILSIRAAKKLLPLYQLE